MRNQPYLFALFLSIFIILVDLYAYRGLTLLAQHWSNRQKSVTGWAFWSLSAITLVWCLWLILSASRMNSQDFYQAVMIFFGFFLLFYLPKLVFISFTLIKDIGLLLAGGSSLIIDKGSDAGRAIHKISRSDFLLKAGLILSSIPFLSVLYGIVWGKYNFTVRRIRLSFPNLPKAFDGTKIVQFSDIHLGSFNGKTEKIEEAVQMINKVEADYILFTGDMVNTLAVEMKPYISVLRSLQAKKGKFSILGNHDYGDYHHWDSEDEKAGNLNRLVQFEEEAGLRLLRNEAVNLENEGEMISLIGLENWGRPPFPQYGDLKEATKNIDPLSFKILMSHDPSHWDAEVLPDTDIDLTLSGHTHGMQFAIRIPGWKWSPVQMKYPRWSGLYREGKQALYVNIGLGFIAFPGRIGTPPEISVFELKRSDSEV